LSGKRFYISAAVVLHLLAAGYAGSRLAFGDAILAWVGTLVACVALPLVLGAMFVWRRARTSLLLPELLLPMLAGTGLAWGAWVQLAPAALATLAFGSGLLYQLWYTPFDRGRTALCRGKPLPDFELRDRDGRAVEASSYRGAPSLFLFIRGNWCPFFVAQVGELTEMRQQLDARGIKVVVVAAQPATRMGRLGEGRDSPFDFLVDDHGRAAARLGILHRGGVPFGLELFGFAPDTMYPTAVLVSAEGVVLHVDEAESYRARPDPAALIALVDAHAATSRQARLSS
jgi:peroxiredoxin